MRESIGTEWTDVRQQTSSGACTIAIDRGQRIADYHLYWLETPRPRRLRRLAASPDALDTPIAAGEYHTASCRSAICGSRSIDS